MDLTEILLELKNERPVFHSEDDFKFSFANAIKARYPSYKIRLERPAIIPMKFKNDTIAEVRAPIDIVVIDDEGLEIPIELKYKTKSTSEKLQFENEIFDLANHGASDIGRVNFRKDIYRIEQYIKLSKKKSLKGFVIIITNEKDYFSDILNKKTLNSNYSFHDSKIPSKDPGWNYNAINKSIYIENKSTCQWHYITDKNKLHWTCKGDLFYQLDLFRNYQINWKDYSLKGDFKYCLIDVSVD